MRGQPAQHREHADAGKRQPEKMRNEDGAVFCDEGERFGAISSAKERRRDVEPERHEDDDQPPNVQQPGDDRAAQKQREQDKADNLAWFGSLGDARVAFRLSNRKERAADDDAAADAEDDVDDLPWMNRANDRQRRDVLGLDDAEDQAAENQRERDADTRADVVEAHGSGAPRRWEHVGDHWDRRRRDHGFAQTDGRTGRKKLPEAARQTAENRCDAPQYRRA